MCSLFFAIPASAATPSAVTPDTDGDGLVDVLERKFGTNPEVKDTDGDGWDDRNEVFTAWSPTNTAPIPLEKSIHIKLKTQRLERRVMGIPIEVYRVSSGRPGMATPTGTFAVRNKADKAWSRASKLWMPYWMAFTTKGHGLHELPYWPGGMREGANHLGIPVSHGCVRLGIGDAKEIYEWSPVGTPVVIEK